jgi:ribosomal protein S18 acetylase RimI-like enzyme
LRDLAYFVTIPPMIPEISALYRLDKSRVKPAAELVMRAFQDYPLSQYFYPDSSQRSKVNRYIASISLYLGVRFGTVYADSPNLKGVACWIPSDHFHFGTWDLLTSVPWSDLAGFWFSGGNPVMSAGAYMDKIHECLAPFEHWYLSLLGVDPQFQGQGHASQLLRPVLAQADRQKIPCYLETNDEKDVLIYLHFGFKVVQEDILPHTPVKTWAMLREAGGS